MGPKYSNPSYKIGQGCCKGTPKSDNVILYDFFYFLIRFKWIIPWAKYPLDCYTRSPCQTKNILKYIEKQAWVQCARAETGKKVTLIISLFDYLIVLWWYYQIMYPSPSYVAFCVPIIFNVTNGTFQIIFLIIYQIVWLCNSKQITLLLFNCLSIIN